MSFRGSRKHVLDWTSTPDFCVELLKLVSPVDAKISAKSSWMPRGHSSPAEARLETFGPSAIDGNAWRVLRTWWLAHHGGANTPNWDIAASCEIDGKAGLILVEAKANVPELDAAGKKLESSASPASIENHQRIGDAINEACGGLRNFASATAISRDTHYQLANRLASAWKLANLGVPIVLVYLGFLGDSGIADAGEPFRDEAHWRGVFASYAYQLAPPELFERELNCGAAPAWFLVRARPVLQASQPRS